MTTEELDSTQSLRNPDCGASAVFHMRLPRWPQRQETSIRVWCGDKFCGPGPEAATARLLGHNHIELAKGLGNVQQLGVPGQKGKTDLGGGLAFSAHCRESGWGTE